MHFTVRAVPPPRYQAWLQQSIKQAESGCPGDTTPGQLAAKNVAFDKDCLSAKAGKPFPLRFDNEDTAPNLHNVAIFRGHDASGTRIQFPDAPFAGPKVVTYSIPALTPGSYFYHCDVHPTAMQGKLIVK